MSLTVWVLAIVLVASVVAALIFLLSESGAGEDNWEDEDDQDPKE